MISGSEVRQTAMSSVIGVDLGGTKITAGCVVDGQLSYRDTVATPAAEGPAAVVHTLLGLVAAVRSHANVSGLEPAAIGIGSAGVIDPDTGTVAAATKHIAGWAGTALADSVGLATGLPTRVLNDVHAHALGEARYGAGHGSRTVLVVAAGTGLGGAIVIDGNLLLGRRGVAGHLGHVPAEEAHDLPCACGRVGHLESVASGPGLLAMYRSRGGQAASGVEVAAAANAAEPLAVDCLTSSGRALGRAIGGWINMLDPDVVIVTGGLAESGPLWWGALTTAVHEQTIDLTADCPVVPAELGASAALLGAALYATTPHATTPYVTTPYVTTLPDAPRDAEGVSLDG